MKVDSEEFRALMKKWSDEAFREETAREYEEWREREANYKGGDGGKPQG